MFPGALLHHGVGGIPCQPLGDRAGGAALAAWSQSRKAQQQIETSQAVTDTKIDELTREVREHNNFARRMPVVEEQVKVINHRLADLEEYHK